MTETTTLREMALVLSINEPGATFAEHLDFVSELAADLGLSDLPDAPLSDVDAQSVLDSYARESDLPDEVGDPDAEYDRVVSAQLEA